jgi:hypothetical protein
MTNEVNGASTTGTTMTQDQQRAKNVQRLGIGLLHLTTRFVAWMNRTDTAPLKAQIDAAIATPGADDAAFRAAIASGEGFKRLRAALRDRRAAYERLMGTAGSDA